MDEQAFRQGARERIANAKTEQLHHQKEMERLGRVIETLEGYLENDSDFTPIPASVTTSSTAQPSPQRKPYEILMVLAQENPKASTAEALSVLQDAGVDFGDKSPLRVAGMAFSMALRVVKKKASETETNVEGG